jgi:hypothetical protein
MNADQSWVVPPLDDLMDVDTPWGRMPLWKCRAMSIAYTQTAIADSAVGQQKTPVKDEDQPPRLAADTDPLASLRRLKTLRERRDILRRCDALEERHALFEQRERLKMAAHAALMAAETAYTAPPSEDDVDGMTMN